jgi:hypothetical protein
MPLPSTAPSAVSSSMTALHTCASQQGLGAAVSLSLAAAAHLHLHWVPTPCQFCQLVCDDQVDDTSSG